MRLDGEITEVASPPNKADRFKCVTIWVPQIEEHVEMTFPMEEFQKESLGEGDQITIKIDKKFDIDNMARDLFKGKI